jgi:hypothetical protein
VTNPEDNPQDNSIYSDEVEREFRRVMQNDPVAVHGYSTAGSFGLDEFDCLKATIVALSNANERLRSPG